MEVNLMGVWVFVLVASRGEVIDFDWVVNI